MLGKRKPTHLKRENRTTAFQELLSKLDNAYEQCKGDTKRALHAYSVVSGDCSIAQSRQELEGSGAHTHEMLDIVTELCDDRDTFFDMSEMDRLEKESISSMCSNIKKERKFYARLLEKMRQLTLENIAVKEENVAVKEENVAMKEKKMLMKKRVREAEAAFDDILRPELSKCNYHIVRCIGQGSFGRVYLCHTVSKQGTVITNDTKHFKYLK